jgi:hypothetical protein
MYEYAPIDRLIWSRCILYGFRHRRVRGRRPIWMIAVAVPYKDAELFTAEAVQAFLAVGGVAAAITLACAMSLSLLVFLVRGPLLNLLKGSLVRYIAAGVVTAAFSVVAMLSLGFPPDPSDLEVAVWIACVAGPASATFWLSTRKGHGSSSGCT